MVNSTLSLTVGLALVLCSMAHAEDKPSVFGEVEIVRGEQVSELKVFIINNGSSAFEFPTGVTGRREVVPEGEIAGGPTGLKVIPRLRFEWKYPDGQEAPGSMINFEAPTFTSSAHNRAAHAQMFVVPPGKRRLYYAFKVPTEYVKGEFKGGYLPRPDIYKPLKGATYGPPELVGAIPITRLIEATDKDANVKQKKKQ